MRIGRRIAALGLVAALAADPVGAQSLTDRVARSEGRVRVAYPVRAGVEVCTHGVWTGSGSRPSGPGDDRGICASQGIIDLTVRQGVVRSVRLTPEPPPPDVDLGVASASDAVAFLLALPGKADVAVGLEAFLPAAIADAPSGSRMLEIARDKTLDRRLRERALNWTSREVGQVITTTLGELARDSDESEAVRQAAVQALARKEDAEVLDALIDVARSAPGGRVREVALRRIARSEDPRAIRFFEEILIKGGTSR